MIRYLGNKAIIVMITTIIGTLSLAANVNTKRPKNKIYESQESQIVELIKDTVCLSNPIKFDKGSITIKGYAKRASDSRESFFLTNHTNLSIGLVQLKIRYLDLNENIIHERTIKVPCDLPAYSTRQVSVKAFDTANTFYFYREKKSRKSGMPFKVSMKVLRYDVIVASDEKE